MALIVLDIQSTNMELLTFKNVSIIYKFNGLFININSYKTNERSNKHQFAITISYYSFFIITNKHIYYWYPSTYLDLRTAFSQMLHN